MAALSAAIVAWPIFSFIRLPRRIGGSRPIAVPLENLHEDQALYFNRQGTQIALIYTDQEPKLFDASCTHLGCLVAWDQNEHVFHCPCHGAVFNDQGAPVSGPISVPLKQIAFEIKDSTIIIA
jgi:cytochrome b6-f complex iron-sulfur subunit